ncbi:Xaa-Pro aminopeptidase [Rhodoligotrophos appendicifer]|uniref:aminopeptidase P family protein n=1 Tax=Rhodoligotrophos appendicifer TaxID=987056 RepID=UPI0011870403|nr:aminopeptidase P family protein [Rhodoligotrophos appendicifer]
MYQSFVDVSDHSKSGERIAALRRELAIHGLHGFIVPRSDEHQGEYVADYAERLRWLTGFSGSAGMAIILVDQAVIFVDGRYTIQVREQVDLSVVEPKHLIDEPPSEWLRRTLRPGQRLGYDPWLLTVEQAERFAKACIDAGAELVPCDNLVDAIWQDQPSRPAAPVVTHPTQLAGRSVADKRQELLETLQAKQAGAVILTQPDSIAWMLNIRGSDVAHTPVALAFAILPAEGLPQLFLDSAKIDAATASELGADVELHSAADFEPALRRLGGDKVRVMIDPAWTAVKIRDLLRESGAEIVADRDPCILPKARKNPVELEGARAAHRRDGAAMANFLHWFDQTAPQAGLDEIAAAEALEGFRAATGELREISFESISAAGPHAAIPHYRVGISSNRPIRPGEIYLIDSGAQYLDGTTDITRTLIVGEPTAEMRDRFTRVLKGMIAISVARFPERTTGAQLDSFARAALWQAGLDFDHGTGHGVGSYLSVHEGPARISKAGTVGLETGMILSNEPGYYKQGDYGIRIENLVIVSPAEPVPGGDRPMHRFETLTLAPIDRRLIDPSLLSEAELAWLNAYHARVDAEIGPRLDNEQRRWLAAATAPITRE